MGFLGDAKICKPMSRKGLSDEPDEPGGRPPKRSREPEPHFEVKRNPIARFLSDCNSWARAHATPDVGASLWMAVDCGEKRGINQQRSSGSAACAELCLGEEH